MIAFTPNFGGGEEKIYGKKENIFEYKKRLTTYNKGLLKPEKLDETIQKVRKMWLDEKSSQIDNQTGGATKINDFDPLIIHGCPRICERDEGKYGHKGRHFWTAVVRKIYLRQAGNPPGYKIDITVEWVPQTETDRTRDGQIPGSDPQTGTRKSTIFTIPENSGMLRATSFDHIIKLVPKYLKSISENKRAQKQFENLIKNLKTDVHDKLKEFQSTKKKGDGQEARKYRLKITKDAYDLEQKSVEDAEEKLKILEDIICEKDNEGAKKKYYSSTSRGKYYDRCKKRLPKDKEDAENSLEDKKENLRVAKEKYEKEEKEYNDWAASQGTGEEDITPSSEESKEEKGDAEEEEEEEGDVGGEKTPDQETSDQGTPTDQGTSDQGTPADQEPQKGGKRKRKTKHNRKSKKNRTKKNKK